MQNNQTGIITCILLIFAGFVLFFGLGYYPLANGKEGQYAEIAREMVSLGDYITPYFNFIPYLDTPPLFYWLTSISYGIFGITTLAARLVPALSALLCVFAVMHFCRRIQQAELGWFSAMILASSLGFIWIGRSAIGDVTFALSTAAAIFYFHLWQEQDKKSDCLLSWFCIGLSILLKGLLALVLILPICFLAFALAQGRHKSFYQFFQPRGLALCAACFLPWYGLFYWQDPALFPVYLSHEQLFRLFGWQQLYGDRQGPFYYYFGRLFILLFPWSFLILPRLLSLFSQRTHLTNLTKLCCVWFLFCLGFYSLVPIKSQYFLISLAVPSAILLGQQVEKYHRIKQNRILRSLFYLVASLAVMVAMAFTVTVYKHDDLFTHSEHAALVGTACILVFAVIGCYINYRYREIQTVAFYLNACIILPIMLVTIVIAGQVKDYYSEYHMAELIDQHFTDKPLFVYHNIEKFSSLIFYTINHVHMIEHGHQLPTQVEKIHQIPSKFPVSRVTLDDFKIIAQHHAVMVTLNNNKQLLRFTQALQPLLFCEVFRDGQALLLSNQTRDCEQFATLGK